jgi:hypothetical protein
VRGDLPGELGAVGDPFDDLLGLTAPRRTIGRSGRNTVPEARGPLPIGGRPVACSECREDLPSRQRGGPAAATGRCRGSTSRVPETRSPVSSNVQTMSFSWTVWHALARRSASSVRRGSRANWWAMSSPALSLGRFAVGRRSLTRFASSERRVSDGLSREPPVLAAFSPGVVAEAREVETGSGSRYHTEGESALTLDGGRLTHEVPPVRFRPGPPVKEGWERGSPRVDRGARWEARTQASRRRWARRPR